MRPHILPPSFIDDSVARHPGDVSTTWRDVSDMLGALGGVEHEERNGTLKVTHSGRTLIVHRPERKRVADAEALMDLRRFLDNRQRPGQRRRNGRTNGL